MGRESSLRLYHAGRLSRSSYDLIRNRVTKLIRDRKKSYFHTKFKELKGDIKRTWTLLNDVIHPNLSRKRGNIEKFIIGSTTYTDSLEIANALNQYFSTVGSSIANSIIGSSSHDQFLSLPLPVNSFFFRTVGVSDVIEYIKSLKNKKCCIGMLPTKVLMKYVSNVVSPIICSLINLSIATSTLPSSLKVARVVPLFKGAMRMILLITDQFLY